MPDETDQLEHYNRAVCFRAAEDSPDSQEKQKQLMRRDTNFEQICFRAAEDSPGQPEKQKIIDETRHQLEQSASELQKTSPGQPREAETTG